MSLSEQRLALIQSLIIGQLLGMDGIFYEEGTIKCRCQVAKFCLVFLFFVDTIVLEYKFLQNKGGAK